MFQFRRFPAYAYLIQRTLTEYCSAGFPHSVISGSTAICASPKLIAACHDLHRLLMPRHSPCALNSLTYFLAAARKVSLWFSEFELCRLQSYLEIVCFTLKSSTNNLCFPLLLALHTLVTLFSFQGASGLLLKPDSNTCSQMLESNLNLIVL